MKFFILAQNTLIWTNVWYLFIFPSTFVDHLLLPVIIPNGELHYLKPSVVAQAYNLSTQEAKAGELPWVQSLCSEYSASQGYIVIYVYLKCKQ